MADSLRGENIPQGSTGFYRALARNMDPCTDPIAAQIIPRPEENLTYDYESSDPLADQQYEIADRLVHHYRDRALLLANDRCAVYCRHCFRRHFTGNDSGRITPQQLDDVCQALAQRPQIQEILISGGDPIMLSDRELENILRKLKQVNPDYIIRISTRIPIVQPRRITASLLDILARNGVQWLIIHTNHPRELSPEFYSAVAAIRTSGIAILNQSVLLKGVNDSVAILEQLFRELLRNGIKPYYLFQGDLAAGTRHFRTSIEKGLAIMDELRTRVSGMGMPTYAVDLPNGGGKIPLNRSTVLRTEGDWYILKGPEGAEYRYPREL